MSRRPARATEADIRRAIHAAEKAGARMAVEILPDGTIRLTPIRPQADASTDISAGREIVL